MALAVAVLAFVAASIRPRHDALPVHPSIEASGADTVIRVEGWYFANVTLLGVNPDSIGAKDFEGIPGLSSPTTAPVNPTPVEIPAATERGTSAADTLQGGDGNDNVYGEGGNDALLGGAGNDYINGGAGADTLWGQDGNDGLDGGAGPDLIYGEAGNDTIAGGEDGDIILAGDGDDAIRGDAGDDGVWAEGGHDTVDGGTGDDFLAGGTGNDSLSGGAGADYLAGEAGREWIRLNPRAVPPATELLLHCPSPGLSPGARRLLAVGRTSTLRACAAFPLPACRVYAVAACHGAPHPPGRPAQGAAPCTACPVAIPPVTLPTGASP